MSLEQKSLFNLFLGHSVQNKPIFDIAFENGVNNLKKDFDKLHHNNFKWQDMEIEEIKERVIFMKLFNQNISALSLNILNTIPFEQLIPLRFIDMITDYPEHSFGQPIYNESFRFFSHLLTFFKRFYLMKDLQGVDRIDAEFIASYTPISREFVVKKNQNNKKIIDKYFSSNFNLHQFAVKLVDKFVVGCTWRWIGSDHTVHVEAIEICKILMKYGLVNTEQIEELKVVLYSKIQTYKTLEDIIDADAPENDIYWVNHWTEGLKKVREYYCEILILMIYRRQDFELLEMLKKFYSESKGCERNVCERKLENIIKFNKSILFQEEFGHKLMEFLLGYVLSQNKINNNYLTTKKIEMISDNFLHIFSNIDDPYLHSIKLIREQDYQIYMDEEPHISENPANENIFSASISIAKILNNLTFGNYIYNSEAIVQDLENIFEDLNNALDFEVEVKSFDFGKKKKTKDQRSLLNSNFSANLVNLMGILTKHQINKVEVMQKFSLILQYQLINNTENHCIFLSAPYLNIILDPIYKAFPLQTVEMMFDIFSKYSIVMLMKEFMLSLFLNIYTKDHDKFDNKEGYNVLSKLIDILALFINIKGTKIYTYIPEYDIRISMALSKKSQYLSCPELENLLKNPQDNEQKLSLFMNTLSLIQTSTTFRFTDETYILLNKGFPLENLKDLIPLCRSNLIDRSVLMDLYTNLHIDFKNQLLDNRTNYYHVKPADMQYEEDPFVDKNYDITLKLFTEEIEYLLDYFYNPPLDFSEEAFYKYASVSVFAAIIKLMNYFLIIKEEDLKKLSHYIQPLEEFQNYILNKKKEFIKIYTQKEMELNSPLKKDLEIQLALSTEKKKLDQIKISGYCKVILESCQQMIGYIPKENTTVTNRSVQKLLSSKTMLEKTMKAYAKSQNFSNRLQVRKENLAQMHSIDKKSQKFHVILSVAGFYEKYKMTKMSVEGEKNVYIASLNDNSKEMKTLTYNLCSFIFNQISKSWEIYEKSVKYNLIGCLCNTLFISTQTIQEKLFEVFKEAKNNDFMDNLWIEMKNSLLYLKFKTNIDKFWNETFTKTIMLMQFHQFLIEDNNKDFKELFGELKLKDDSIDRVQRWTTIFQKLTENFSWHTNYEPDEIGDFERSHRSYILPLATKTFDNLSELCTGPCLNNQKKVCRFIYDKYNGVLNRYWRDPDTEFYRMKLALIEFMNSLSEGLHPEVISYQTINLDLKNLNKIMVNSLKQLYYCKGLKQAFVGKKMDEYSLKMTDFQNLMHFFETHPEFSKHTLLAISVKIYSYIKMLTLVMTKYDLFIKERNYLLEIYERKKILTFKSGITEEDLVVFRFLNKICIRVEIMKEDVLVNYYFQILPKSFYLSSGTKEQFLNEVIRESQETKITGLMSNVKYFEIEMNHNEQKYQNFYLFYKIFSSKTVYILELLCLAISIIINVILLVHYQDELTFDNNYYYAIVAIAVIEIVISVISIFSWSFLNYNLIRKINQERFLEKYAWKEELTLFDKFQIDVWQSFLKQKSVFLFLFHIITIFLGLNVSKGFFGIDLLSVISLFPTMQYIIRSVTEHASQLFSTLCLAAVIMFSYGIFMIMYFNDNLTSDVKDSCSSLISCYFLIINKAFRNGEGIGGLLEIPFFGVGGGDVMYYFSLILNLSFFLLINTVFLNIILAVLVDTFSELRGKSDEFSTFFSLF